MSKQFEPRVALLQDALPFIGGAERTLMAALEVFPDAPVYTLVYNQPAFAKTPLANARVIPSYLDRLPAARSRHRWYFPLMPGAIERLTIPDADVILSFSYAVAHGFRPVAGQCHISYTLTPMRYAYQGQAQFIRRLPPGPLRWAARSALERFRRWDAQSVRGVYTFAAISAWIAAQVQMAYNQSAQVIYPPVEINRFRPLTPRGEYYLVVSRLVAHKNIDAIVEAFNRLGKPLLVAGSGPEAQRLRRLARPNVSILGWVDDQRLPALYGMAKAVIHACADDFGISLGEALAAGNPLIALAHGSALELVQEGENGLLYQSPTPEDILAAVDQYETLAANFDPQRIRRSAMRFAPERFKDELFNLVEETWRRFQNGSPSPSRIRHSG